MPKKALPLSGAYRLLNPGHVVLVSAGDGERDNLLTITWNMPVKKDPGMVALLLGRRHFSYPLIQKTGELAINVMHARHVDAVYGCGITTGRNVGDKFALFSLTREPAAELRVPLVAEAIANVECRVRQTVDLDSSGLIIADIVAARAEESYWGADGWQFRKDLELLHHLGGNRFCVSDSVLSAKKL